MAVVAANDIYKDVLDGIFDLKNSGELEIPILGDEYQVPTQDDFLRAYFQNEHELTVEYKGNRRVIPCDINTDDDNLLARKIMQGFAKINLNVESKQYRNMNKKQVIRFTESDLHRIIKGSVKKVLKEAYNQHNELQRFAYENQQIRPMIKKLADFAESIAQIGKMNGKDNYYQFYHKLNGDILQMDNLWNFLDGIDN